MNKRITIVLCFALIFVMSGGLILSAFPIEARAATTQYSGVLEDLSKDETFNPEDYPAIADDYSLKVIQVAEGENGELFLYVYQPSAEWMLLTASSVNISVQKNQKNINNYSVQLLSTSGVFSKYLVEDFEVEQKDERLYFISSIFRPFDNAIDESPTDDNKIDQISYGVGQLWTVKTENDEISYFTEYVDLITIDSEHRGFIRYMDLKLFENYSYTDSHYIAFSTDKPIDNLLEAEISFWYKTSYLSNHSSIYHSYLNFDNTDSIEPCYEHKILSSEEIFSRDSLFFDSYEYKRIQSTEEFLKNETEEFTEEAIVALGSTEWVLRFFETGYTYSQNALCGTDTSPCYSYIKESTQVYGITTLRLEYKYDGKIYNLGVVDNIGQGDSNPDNKNWNQNEEPEWLQKFLFVVTVAIFIWILTMLSPFISMLFKLILDLLILVVQMLLQLIILPFKLIGRLFK